MKRLFNTTLIATMAFIALSAIANNLFAAEKTVTAKERVIVAYVTSWSRVMPDPKTMTHINYAFGHVTNTFDGVRIDNEERLKSIVALKKDNPQLKVMLSVGGWGSGRFSEMAADDRRRMAFAEDCRRVVEDFGLDGIDIDWEYPTSNAAGISSSEDDTANFTLLMRDLRKALGKKYLLTLASVGSAKYVDFKAIDKYINFVNIMAYDMGGAPKHHTALYPSKNTNMSSTDAVKAHIEAGVPAHKLVLGMAFYGRGGKNYPNFQDYKDIPATSDKYIERWDDEAKAPYLTDLQGNFVFGFENPRSLAGKCRYVLENGLKGAMYWDYDGDNEAGDLRNTVYQGILGTPIPDEELLQQTLTTTLQKIVPAEPTTPRLLVLTERGGHHKGFTDAAMAWLNNFAKENGYEITEINNTEKINKEFLAQHKVFIQLDYVPYNWTDTAKAAFEQAIFDGSIGWVGFHHATLLGDFDGFKMWEWFSDYMGGIKFKNYIAPLADGEVVVERKNHPVMQGVSPKFKVTKEEWYTFDKTPRGKVDILAHVDEATYSPKSDVTMGDHPVVWTNPRMKSRNVYFLMGHDKELMENKDFTTMFSNAIKWAAGPANWFPRFRVLIHYNKYVEEAHRQFAEDGVRFFKDMTIGDGLVVDVTDDINDFNDEKLRSYHLVISLNDNPGHSPEQRAAFERYMKNGGAWFGFHSAGYNDRNTNWPWFVDFLGGAIFNRNNWPPQSAKLEIDDPRHPVTKGMPRTYISPQNEWYQFRPSPREKENVKVLVTLSKDNYPIGFKDTVTDGDWPVVWSNTDYNMIYMNMGHGTRIFVDPTQNYLVYNAMRWLMRDKF